MKASLLILILLCTAAAAHAQTAAKREAAKRVTVNLKKGEAVSGDFVRADSKTVYVEVEGEEVTISLDEVASLVFSTAAETPAAKALKALNSLAEILGPRLKHNDYINRFLEVRAVVTDQLPHIPEGELREAVGDAFRAFEIAAEIWEAAVQQSQPAEETTKMTRDTLNTTWNGARRRIKQAEGLLSKQP